jgi:hypothetical protein
MRNSPCVTLHRDSVFDERVSGVGHTHRGEVLVYLRVIDRKGKVLRGLGVRNDE